MSNYELYEIRPLRERDVIGVLRIIGDVCKKHGLEGRVLSIAHISRVFHRVFDAHGESAGHTQTH
jgi:hypothetical protein